MKNVFLILIIHKIKKIQVNTYSDEDSQEKTTQQYKSCPT